MTEAKLVPVYWEGEVVGFIAQMEVDGFHVYGDWFAEDSPTTEQFIGLLYEIEATGDEGLLVGIGDDEPKFSIQHPPEVQISLTFLG